MNTATLPADYDDAYAVKPAAPGPVPVEGQGSQATRIEQSRAVAEVFGAIRVAREFPRSEAQAFQKMREACGSMRLAERAFFRFPRGGQTVSGESVHLARELARCWGNIDYGVKELARDDVKGVSEMLAFAWDLETNARSEVTFIVPHMRDKKGGPQKIADMRDIYENNANQGARRLRECIFAVLPPAFKEEAKAICHATLEHGGGKPLAQRIADMLAAFESIGVTRAQVEKRIGRSADHLTAHDVAQMGVIFKSIHRGEVRREDEFPDDTAANVTAELKSRVKEAASGADAENLPPPEPPAQSAPGIPDDGWPGPDTAAQRQAGTA